MIRRKARKDETVLTLPFSAIEQLSPQDMSALNAGTGSPLNTPSDLEAAIGRNDSFVCKKKGARLINNFKEVFIIIREPAV